MACRPTSLRPSAFGLSRAARVARSGQGSRDQQRDVQDRAGRRVFLALASSALVSAICEIPDAQPDAAAAAALHSRLCPLAVARHSRRGR